MTFKKREGKAWLLFAQTQGKQPGRDSEPQRCEARERKEKNDRNRRVLGGRGWPGLKKNWSRAPK